MALSALVIGTSVAAVSTERVTVSLVLTCALAWSFVPAIQLGTGLWLVRRERGERRMSALERYFETHRPWSLFILAVHGLLLAWPAARPLTLVILCIGAAIPITLTVFALTRLCREALGMSARSARRAVMVHQLMTLLVAAAYMAWASAYYPRLVGLVS